MGDRAWSRERPDRGWFWFYGAKSQGAAVRLVLVRIANGMCYSVRSNGGFFAHLDQMDGWWQHLDSPNPPPQETCQ